MFYHFLDPYEDYIREHPETTNSTEKEPHEDTENNDKDAYTTREDTALKLLYDEEKDKDVNDNSIYEDKVGSDRMNNKDFFAEAKFSDEIDVKYLIIGGGVAGFQAAKAILSVDETAQVLMLSSENYPPYKKTWLSKKILAQHRRLNGPDLIIKQIDNDSENKEEKSEKEVKTL
ncbi:MAG: flavodoxin nitric oxide synthase [Paramarteilia canceri]